MGRPPRTSLGGYVYHVVSTGRQSRGIFRTDADYEEFEQVLKEAHLRFEPRLLAYCCLPNRWHLVVVPRKDGDLSKYMAWLVMTHSARWHAKPRREQTGGLYEPRFKSFPVQDNQSLLEVMRYVESLPSREKAARKNSPPTPPWPWSSTKLRGQETEWLSMPPIALPHDWVDEINQPMSTEVVVRIEHSIQRGTPYGLATWVQRVAQQMRLESTLRPRGRPPRANS